MADVGWTLTMPVKESHKGVGEALRDVSFLLMVVAVGDDAGVILDAFRPAS